MSRALIVRLPNPLGDVVAATPLLAWLRRRGEGRRVLAAGRAPALELLDGLEDLDGLLEIPAGAGVRAEARILRGAGAQEILLLPNSWSSALAAHRAGIPVRAGRGRHGRGLLLTKTLPRIRRAARMDLLYLELAGALGLPLPPREAAPATRLAVTAEGRTRAEARLRRHGFAEAGLLAVSPGAAFGPSKVYPVELLARAVARVVEKRAWVPVLLGSPAEAPLLRRLDEALQAEGVRQRLPTHEEPAGIAELKALLERSRVLLGADAGPRHIAAALGVPQVVLFGPTHPGWSSFRTERLLSLRRGDVSCSPCHKAVCPLDHRCMTRIPPEEVAFAVLEAGS